MAVRWLSEHEECHQDCLILIFQSLWASCCSVPWQKPEMPCPLTSTWRHLRRSFTRPSMSMATALVEWRPGNEASPSLHSSQSWIHIWLTITTALDIWKSDSFVHHVLQKISSVSVDTKLRGIEATCIISGDMGVSSCSQYEQLTISGDQWTRLLMILILCGCVTGLHNNLPSQLKLLQQRTMDKITLAWLYSRNSHPSLWSPNSFMPEWACSYFW